jgi:hypothetical protein
LVDGIRAATEVKVRESSRRTRLDQRSLREHHCNEHTGESRGDRQGRESTLDRKKAEDDRRGA